MTIPFLACDLCELNSDLVWIYTLHGFTVIVAADDDSDTTEWPEGDQWAVCMECRRDIDADDQHAILSRRRRALARNTPGWFKLSPAECQVVTQTAELMVMTALASIRKDVPGRMWTAEDARRAVEQMREHGGRF